jgi:hypothetical protein
MVIPERFDVDLGDGHWIRWTEFQGQRCGGIIHHTRSTSETGLCAGSFWTDNRYNEACGTMHHVWQLSGTPEAPTLVPSFLCHCADHGFVQNGKWVRV